MLLFGIGFTAVGAAACLIFDLVLLLNFWVVLNFSVIVVFAFSTAWFYRNA